MPCPNCGSHNLWDDNLAWGCHDCPWFTTGDVRNSDASHDRFLTHEEYRREKAGRAYVEPAPASGSVDPEHPDLGSDGH